MTKISGIDNGTSSAWKGYVKLTVNAPFDGDCEIYVLCNTNDNNTSLGGRNIQVINTTNSISEIQYSNDAAALNSTSVDASLGLKILSYTITLSQGPNTIKFQAAPISSEQGGYGAAPNFIAADIVGLDAGEGILAWVGDTDVDTTHIGSSGNTEGVAFGNYSDTLDKNIYYFFPDAKSGFSIPTDLKRVNAIDGSTDKWGGYVEYKVNAKQAGDHTIYVLGFAGSNGGTRQVQVTNVSNNNAVVASENASTYTSNSTSNMMIVITLNVSLVQGENVLRFQAPTGKASPNFVGMYIQGISPTVTWVESGKDSGWYYKGNVESGTKYGVIRFLQHYKLNTNVENYGFYFVDNSTGRILTSSFIIKTGNINENSVYGDLIGIPEANFADKYSAKAFVTINGKIYLSDTIGVQSVDDGNKHIADPTI